MKVLIVEDDRELVDLLTFALRRAGFDVLPAYDSPTALKLLEADRPDLAVVDVNLGSSNGFDLVRDLRQRSRLPVIMLTGRHAEDDKILALELGADDYVTKPFSHRELIARIRAHLRRGAKEWSPPAPPEPVLQVGPIVLNVAEHAATKGRQPLDLTVTEFRLLRYLMSNPGRVAPTPAILKQVWGYDDPRGTDVLRVTVHRLRRKLEDDPDHPRLLHTVPGVGVTLKPESA